MHMHTAYSCNFKWKFLGIFVLRVKVLHIIRFAFSSIESIDDMIISQSECIRNHDYDLPLSAK